MWRVYQRHFIAPEKMRRAYGSRRGGWGFPEGYVFSSLVGIWFEIVHHLGGSSQDLDTCLICPWLVSKSPRPGAMWDPFQIDWKMAYKWGWSWYIYIYIYIYLEPNWPLFWGLTFHFMGQIFQNMGHLGSRYIHLYIFTSIPYPAVIHCGPMTTVTARPAWGEWWSLGKNVGTNT